MLYTEVVLVTEQDEPIGTMEKMQAHREGCLHRAFSVFIFNSRGEMLLQRRAAAKYHSPGLWTNACCSHPQADEAPEAAAHRRLREELNFDTDLQLFSKLYYKADVGDGLIEHEYDHLFSGFWDEAIKPNPDEVSDTRFMTLEDVDAWMKKEPQAFTAWFHLAFPKLEPQLPLLIPKS